MATVLSIFSLMLNKGHCLAFVFALVLPVPVYDSAHVACSSLLFLLWVGIQLTDRNPTQEPAEVMTGAQR